MQNENFVDYFKKVAAPLKTKPRGGSHKKRTATALLKAEEDILDESFVNSVSH